MRDQWYENLRCPTCGKTGKASLSQDDDDAPTPQIVPDGSAGQTGSGWRTLEMTRMTHLCLSAPDFAVAHTTCQRACVGIALAV
jgi:hypothetical protein